MCIVRQSGAGVSLGNTICSARAISKCPLVVTPCVVVGISSSPFCPGSPWDLPWGICAGGRTVPALPARAHSLAFPTPLHCQVLQQNPQRVPDSIPAAGQDSPGAEHLAWIAAHVSAHPFCPAPSGSRAASAQDARALSRALSLPTSVRISANLSKKLSV